MDSAGSYVVQTRYGAYKSNIYVDQISAGSSAVDLVHFVLTDVSSRKSSKEDWKCVKKTP